MAVSIVSNRSRMPLVWLSICRRLMFAAFGKSGRYLDKGSSRPIVPATASLPIRAATKVLLMLPIENSVSVVSDVLGERTAEPETPLQIEPSGKTMAAEAPGYLPPVRTPSRAV